MKVTTILGCCNQLIVRFTSAAHPNLELENLTFLGRKNEVLTTADMSLQERIDFFHATLLLSMPIYTIANHRQYY